MNFSNASNITLSDSLSGYVTCDEEDSDNTRYLSVLSQDVSFEGLSVTLCNSEVDEDDTQLVEITSDDDINQPFIFTIDGSNEIYGVQTAHDEDGNLQKYQMQYIKNMEGELIPMLETIQLLPSEYDVHSEIAISNNLITTDSMNVEVPQTASHNQFVNKEENNSEFEDDINNHEDEFNQNDEDTTDVTVQKLELASNSSLSYSNVHIKQESLDLFDENCRHSKSHDHSDSYFSEEIEITKVKNLKVEANIPDALVQIEMNESNADSAEDFEVNSCIENEEQVQVLSPVEEHFEQLFVQENHISEGSHNVDDIIDNDSDNETYHIVDGMHVTGDVESANSFEQSVESVLTEAVEHHPKTNILKKSASKCISKDQACSDQKIIYVQTLPEKENMEIFEVESVAKPNSRSLLKCNQPHPLMTVPDPLHIELLVGEGTYLNTKRYSRTKEAKQARQFLNFINSTTIPQVPERKERLPRKQQIKLVQHANEDIIVKEMIVSSNGFIEPHSAGEKKYLPVTEYVEVLDSGDECSGVGAERRKKRSKKQVETVEIEISDSDSSETGVCELGNQLNDVDEEQGDVINKIKITKKKRGRPPKNKNVDNDKKDSDSNSESPPKISRTETDVESVTSSLEVIRVENDTIRLNSDNSTNNALSDELNSEPTFQPANYNITNFSADDNSAGNKDGPSQKTTNTEMQTIKGASNIHEIQRKGFDYKHECEKCKTKFINKFLLNRHDCIVKSGLPFSCVHCQKKFPNVSTLNVHKKIHTKVPQIVKSSSLTKIPQVPKTFSKEQGTIKCASNNSASSMKKPPIKNPIRESIIPVKNPIRSRASTIKCPPRPLMVSSKIGQNNFLKPQVPAVVLTPDRTSKTNIFKCEKQCDKCSERFDNNAAWFDHQVLKHGFKTPDKHIGEKKPKKLVKTVVAHNGIRAAPALAKNFSMLRSKMQQLQ